MHDLRVPHLLLVEDGHHPPDAADCLEDWVRVPASETDVRARIDGLLRRLDAHGVGVDGAEPDGDERPVLDEDGVLRAGGTWVPVPRVEARLLGALLERYEAVVSRDSLNRVGWPSRVPDRNVLDVHVLRLRRRIAPLGLSIKTIRSRGYLLESNRRPLRSADSA